MFKNFPAGTFCGAQIFCLYTVFLNFFWGVSAQVAPAPGAEAGGAQLQSAAPPKPVALPLVSAPVPGSGLLPNNSTTSAAYQALPISPESLSRRLEQLRNAMPVSRPKDFQDAVNSYLEWISDMGDAHWRIYQVFAKVDSLKAQAELEKQTTLKIGRYKRQALLLKAEFLIRQHREAEALQPLVDIVVAEPKTETGEAAYQLLKQIGFSEPISSAGPASP